MIILNKNNSDSSAILAIIILILVIIDIIYFLSFCGQTPQLHGVMKLRLKNTNGDVHPRVRDFEYLRAILQHAFRNELWPLIFFIPFFFYVSFIRRTVRTFPRWNFLEEIALCRIGNLCPRTAFGREIFYNIFLDVQFFTYFCLFTNFFCKLFCHFFVKKNRASIK